MILTALNELYERINVAEGAISQIGFAPMGISGVVVLKPNGELLEQRIHDFRKEVLPNSKKGKSKFLPTDQDAPSAGKRTSGIKSGFLCEKTDYVLGRNLKKEQEKADSKQRIFECFDAFQKLHFELQDKINDREFDAVCKFLKNWKPEYADQIENFTEFSGLNLAFQIQGETHFVHDLTPCRKAWSNRFASMESDAKGFCLITNQAGDIESVHPAIKGIRDPGGQAEKGIVNFNKPSFCSYGKKQSQNAPVSIKASFQYTTALNWLLDQDGHRIFFSDVTSVFWTEKPSLIEDVLTAFFGKGDDSQDIQDENIRSRLQTFLEILRQGGGRWEEFQSDSNTKFYLLGLAPNASRLSIRFWHQSTLGDLVDRLRKHYEALRIVKDGQHKSDFPPIWMLLRETARESKDIPPLLGGSLMRAILTGSTYPQAFYTAILNRIRVDHKINYLRAGTIKAFLIRNKNQEIPTMLDPNKPDIAYRLGRLFAALEKTQEDALNVATIRERFYSSASATPGIIFPRLLRTYQHHLAKLEGGRKVNRERLIQEIFSPLTDFPSNLSLEQQGSFAIGYYHQRQDFFTKKEKEISTADKTTTES